MYYNRIVMLNLVSIFYQSIHGSPALADCYLKEYLFSDNILNEVQENGRGSIEENIRVTCFSLSALSFTLCPCPFIVNRCSLPVISLYSLLLALYSFLL
jgi:hypothetical protein